MLLEKGSDWSIVNEKNESPYELANQRLPFPTKRQRAYPLHIAALGGFDGCIDLHRDQINEVSCQNYTTYSLD